MAEAIAQSRSSRGHVLPAVLCALSMAIGAIAMYTMLNAGPNSPTAVSSTAPDDGAGRSVLPAVTPAQGARSVPAPGMIRAYYTDSQTGTTTVAVFPVAAAGPSAPCGRSITSTPLCQGIQIQCEPAPDGVYRWTLTGFCE